jgi:3-phenylpropionate/trans-cinnamate dioxygenase ferredoxin reductase component
MVVVGAGIQLNTELAAAAGLSVDGGVLVDEYLQTSVRGIYAAGDVASFPDPLGGRRHVEHWDNAIAHGRVAGANMAGKRVAFRHVPYFWSDLFDLTINVVGFLDGAEETILRGTLEERRFTVLALRGGALRGALMVNRARDRRPLTELIRRQTPLRDWLDKLADPGFDPATIVGPES